MTELRKHIVVLTGAGISAESGLKTFRDEDGLWNGHNVYEVATPGGWKKNPALVLEFYNMRRREVLKAKPNEAHVALAKLEEKYDVSIITQNIDDLHERAGSKKVFHLHGEIFKMRSEANENLVEEIRDDIKIGDHASDGFQYRPNIVWFEEPVPMIEFANHLTRQADIFIIVGTSLQVYPAAGLIDYVPAAAQMFIIDKKMPTFNNNLNMVTIEMPASEGCAELLKLLM
jgi:NAD-dependent deacetylase